MTTLDRDKAALRDYERELAEAQAIVSELRPVVDGLRARVARQEGRQQARPPQNSVVGSVAATMIPPRRPAGGIALIEALRRIMADGQTRHVDQIAAALAAYGLTPATRTERQSMNNRLYDLKEAGYLIKSGRGVYRLATRNGSAPADSDPGVTPGTDEDQESTPDGGPHAAHRPGP